MTAQEYIQSQLIKLKEPLEFQEVPADKLEEAIFRILMSKKFRKYSANESLQLQMREALKSNIRNNRPINITFLHGAYKLWRLDESPEVDWAELFSLIYYSNWVKQICAIYKHGVWFDFFVDDLIVPKLNNVDIREINEYLESYNYLIKFIKNYQPTNLNMTITTVGSRFSSEDEFNKNLNDNIELKRKELGGLPELSEKQAISIEFNVKVTKDQLENPKWKEEVALIESGYGLTKASPQYHKNRPEKILAFTQPLPGGTTISVGTTKSSIMKFWIGAGALKYKEDNYQQLILSPKQLAAADFHWEDVKLKGLEGKNFKRIRILN